MADIGIPPDWKQGSKVVPRSSSRTASTTDSYSPHQKLVNLEEIHKKYTGKGITIGIGDTGWIPHNDLKEPIGTFDVFKGDGKDETLHGTHVRGIISMMKNDRGLVGVAPGSDIVLTKVLGGPNGTGSFSGIAEGIKYMANRKCNLINLSLGGSGGSNSKEVNDAIDYAFSKGCYCVVASGNENRELIGYPANRHNVIAIGAVDLQKQLAWFSNRGVELDGVSYGVDIVSTGKDNGWYRASGTSMATPFATGLIALFWEYFRDTEGRDPSFQEIMLWIQVYSEDLVDEGFDVATGYGVLTTNFGEVEPECPECPEHPECPGITDYNPETVTMIQSLYTDVENTSGFWWFKKRSALLKKLSDFYSKVTS